MAEERDWASLEKGLVRDIFVRLENDIDAASFRSVCPGWRVATGAGTPVPRPWFILNPADDDGAQHGRHAFVRPVHRRCHANVRSVHANVSGESPPACVRGTSRGWLAVEEGERLLLRDPISRAEIPLPAFDDAGCKMFDVFLSDNPLALPASWTAFAFFRWDGVYAQNPGDVLAFCRPGDAEWARVVPVDDGLGHQITRRYRGLEFFEGRPYVLLARTEKLAVCDVKARRLVVSSVRVYTLQAPEFRWQECLVECGGDLLVVQVWRNSQDRWPWYCPMRYLCCRDYFRRQKIQYFAMVYKIMFAQDGSGMPAALELVQSVRDYAVFVAPQGHAFALRARDFPAVRKGCVYFFDVNYTKNVQAMVVIDLQAADPKRQNKIVRKLPLDGNWHILSWFCPRPVVDTTPPPPRRRRCSMHGLRNALPFLN